MAVPNFNEKTLLRHIGAVVKFIREEKELTQAEFANQCGFCRSFIAQIEKEHRNISILNLHKLALKNNLNIADFLPYDKTLAKPKFMKALKAKMAKSRNSK